MSLVTSTLLGTEKKNLNSQTVLHTRTHSSQNATRVLKQLHLSRVLKSAKKEVTLSLTRFLLFPIFKKFLFFFSVKTAHSYLMPRVLSKLRDQHSSNYTMSWHTAHAALEPNGSILPLAEISTGEEGREGSRTRSAKAIGARGFRARLCSCSGQYSSCDHSEAQGQVQSGEGRAPLSSSSHRELQAKSKGRVTTRLVLGTTDHHSHGLPPQW